MRKVAPRPIFMGLLTVSLAAMLSSCNAPMTKLTPATSSQQVSQDTHVAIADGMNNRVLIFGTPVSTNESASLVLGQPDFSSGMVSGAYPAAKGGLNNPMGLAADSEGNLYVADNGNCRVVQFAPPFTNGMTAKLVLGQPDLTAACNSSQQQVDARGMLTPGWIASDSHGDLWVADAAADRITEYVPPFTSGMAAKIAIGQPNLTSTRNSCNGEASLVGGTPSASSVCQPMGIAFDSHGNLWVADSNNNRILEYEPPFSTGMSATLEIGQSSGSTFGSADGCGSDPTAASLCQPRALTFDGQGNLWVTDSEDWRVLEFSPPFANGMAATTVLGQPDFTHRNESPGNAGPTTVGFPNGLAFDSKGELVVADPEGYRVLFFAPPFSNGMSAATVLGQPDMTTAASSLGTVNGSTLALPNAVLPF